MGARRRVIYAAPSVSLEVSSALINVGERLGAGMVSVVLDVSEDVFRLGYGVVDALNMLHERNIAVRHADGLRISFVVVDDEGFIFAIPPLLVDGGRKGDDHPNAVRASLDQIERLLDAVQPGPTNNSFKPDESASANEASECAGREASPLLDRAEIGQKAATRTQIETIDLSY